MSQEEHNPDVVEKVHIIETVDELADLEPITIGLVTEVTGSGDHGDGDEAHVVWGD